MNLQEELERARDAAPTTELDVAAIYRKREQGARTRQLATISAALTIGLAGVVAIVLTFGDIADRRSAAPSVELGLPAGSYYYERIDRYNLIPLPGTPDIETATDELWLAPDGSGRFYAHGKIVNYYEPFPGGGAHQDVSFSAGESPWEWVELPADPDAMRDVLLSNGAPGGSSPVPATPSPGIAVEDWRIVRAAQDLLDRNALYLAPPQRQALFLVLRDLSFFEVTTDALDPLGRTATELTAVVDEDRIRWYFDEGTGQWLARVLEKAKTGDLLTAELMVRQGVVGDTNSPDPEPSFVERPPTGTPELLETDLSSSSGLGLRTDAPCELVSIEEVESATDSEVRFYEIVPDEQMILPNRTDPCRFITNDEHTSISVPVERESVEAFIEMRDRDPVNTELVAGLGDEAFIEGQASVWVRVSNDYFVIASQQGTGSEGVKELEALARMALD